METQRQTYLDWLRIFSIFGVLLFHSAMPYVAEDGWHLKNRETSNLMMEVNLFLHLIRMPLLFFISGTVSYYMMKRRSAINFIGLRFRRLFIPLLAGIFIVVPPQIYIERLAGGYTGSFLDWYPGIFDFVPYPTGDFSFHHLWFIAYLFIYDVVLGPLFAWLLSPKAELLRKKLQVLARGKRVYFLMLPSITWFAVLNRSFPETNDIVNDTCYFGYWFFFLMAGFICILQPRLMDSLQRNRRSSLTVGFLALVLLSYLRWNKIEPGEELWPVQHEVFTYFFDALKPLIAWGWVLALTGYAKQYLNKQHRSLNYMNQAAYPFYILHQTVIVILTYYIIELQNESILSKFLFTLGITFFVTTLTYHLLIAPFALMRFLFGMKPKEKQATAEVQRRDQKTDAVPHLISVP